MNAAEISAKVMGLIAEGKSQKEALEIVLQAELSASVRPAGVTGVKMTPEARTQWLQGLTDLTQLRKEMGHAASKISSAKADGKEDKVDIYKRERDVARARYHQLKTEVEKAPNPYEAAVKFGMKDSQILEFWYGSIEDRLDNLVAEEKLRRSLNNKGVKGAINAISVDTVPARLIEDLKAFGEKAYQEFMNQLIKKNVRAETIVRRARFVRF